MKGLRLAPVAPWIFVVALGVGGCSPAPSASPGQDTSAAPAPALAAEPIPGDSAAAKPVPAPAKPKPAEPVDAELVRNGEFDAWAEGLPTYWTATHPKNVIEDRAKGNDSRCMQIGSLKKEWVGVWQGLKAGARAKGKTVEVSARIKGDHANMARLSVSYGARGERHAEQALYNLDTRDWQKVVVRTELPADYDPNTLAINVSVRPHGKTICYVDSVTAKILK